MALSWTMDKLGPMARSAEDCQLVLGTIAGVDPGDPSSLASPAELKGSPIARDYRVGVFRPAVPVWEDESAHQVFEDGLRVLARVGCRIDEAKLPDLPFEEAAGIILACESVASFEPILSDPKAQGSLPKNAANAIEASKAIRGADYVRTMQARRIMQRELDRVFEKFDVLISPASPSWRRLSTRTSSRPFRDRIRSARRATSRASRRSRSPAVSRRRTCRSGCRSSGAPSRSGAFWHSGACSSRRRSGTSAGLRLRLLRRPSSKPFPVRAFRTDGGRGAFAPSVCSAARHFWALGTGRVSAIIPWKTRASNKMSASQPRDESARLEALRRYQILDTSAEQAFDDLTRLASLLCGTPMAVMSLIDENRQWFKSRVGIEIAETPRAVAFCAHTIQQRESLVVPDAARDDRFRNNPFVKAKDGIRFYAGVPLITPDGHAIGTLSVMDRKSRQLEARQLDALRALARQAEKQLEVRVYVDRLARTIQERETVERRLREANQFTSEIIDGAAQGIVVYDRSFRYVVWNRFMEELTGMPSKHVLGNNAMQLFPHVRGQGIHALLDRALAGEKVSSESYRFEIPQTGRVGWVNGTYGPHRNASGEITGVIGVIRDVSETMRAQEAQTAAEAKFRGLVEQSLVGIYVIQDGRFQYVNPKLAEIIGYTPDEVLAFESVLDVVVEEDHPIVKENIRKRLEGESKTVRYSFRAMRKDGEQVELEVHGAATEYLGRPAIIGTLLDITDRKRAEAQIVYHAYHDPLTELPNRMLFMERLRLQLAQAKRQNRRLSIVYFDLDRFKFVNDTLGHSVGDEFLQTVATRLKGLVREMDTVARSAGDEFVILIPDVARAEDISVIAQKLLNSVARPLQVEGRALQITASAGVSTYPADGRTPRRSSATPTPRCTGRRSSAVTISSSARLS
jgi:diguanylate cyclase (GGDEF)-like protein/PAS domain S-box-containing protein